jgi:hypothetical protein
MAFRPQPSRLHFHNNNWWRLQIMKNFVMLFSPPSWYFLAQILAFSPMPCPQRSCDSAVGIATGYGLDGRGVGVRIAVEAWFFSTTRRPDRFWSPPSILSNGYRVLFSGGKAAGAWSTRDQVSHPYKIIGLYLYISNFFRLRNGRTRFLIEW